MGSGVLVNLGNARSKPSEHGRNSRDASAFGKCVAKKETLDMKIDAFAHVLPPRYLEERNRRAGDRFTSQYKKYSSAVPALSNLETRFRVMDQFPDVQLLLTIAGPNIESITEPRDTVEIARIANDELAKLVSDHPARFVGAVTCMPMNDVDAALHEAERCIDELGFHGVAIFTDINGKPLDSAEFFPLYENDGDQRAAHYLASATDQHDAGLSR